MSLIPTASQTVGPFFNFALTTNPDLGNLAGEGVKGERVRLTVRVVDGDGVPAPGDALIELWQADSRGCYAHALDTREGERDPHFYGFGRLETDANGESVFETIKPGPVPDGSGGMQAPHINVIVLARGLLRHLYTRIYFAGEPANAHDAALAQVPEHRRETLVAHAAEGQGNAWRFEIRLCGEAETVFFDV